MNFADFRKRTLTEQLRGLTDSFLGAVLGALVYAAWAVAVNWEASHALAWRAGAAHWLMSTFITYYGTTLMRRFFALGSHPTEGAVFSVLGGLTFTYSVLLTVHYAIGTPNIALTLAAGVIPNFLFCGGYSLLLLRSSPADAVAVRPPEGV